jgi:amino acid transporter
VSASEVVIEDPSEQLEHGAVGAVPVLFQSITTIAPAAGAATGLLFTTTYAGGSTPLTIVLAGIACALVAVTIAQFSRHLTSAGGLYTYVTHGLGSKLGFLTGWGLVMAYAFIPALYWGFFGLLIKGEFSGAPSWLWAPIAVAIAVVVGTLAYRGVGISTRVGVILGVIELTVLLVLALTLIGNAGSRNTLSVFAVHTGNQHGLGSVFAGMIYTILAFIGFEAAAPIAEESRNPRRTVSFAIVASAIGVGLFYLIVYYGATVYFGPHNIAANFAGLNGGDPFRELANRVWGGAGIIVLLVVLNSIFACCNGSTNAGSRMMFSLARSGILPRRLAETHRTHHTPAAAVVTLTTATLAIALVVGFVSSGPLDVFAIFGTALTIVFIPIYVIVALASGVYYWRERRPEFRVILHVIVPVIAALIFIPVEIASLGINFFGLGIAPVTGPAHTGLWIALGWMLVGVAYLCYLVVTAPERVLSLGQVFGGQDPSDALEPPPAVVAGPVSAAVREEL